MKELQRRQRIRRIIYSIPSILLLAILTFFLTKGSFGIIGKDRESAARLDELRSKVTALSLREKELENEIARLQTEEGIMNEIRGRFVMTQEDEHVAVIVDESQTSTSTDLSDKSWYKRLWHAIIHLYD